MISINNLVDSIHTPRCIIRQYHPDDAEIVRKTVEENIPHLSTWMPWVNQYPKSLNEMRAEIRKWNASFLGNTDYPYAIFLSDNKTYIGSTGFHLRQGFGIFEIGYWMSKDFINLGFATEISYALTRVGLKIIGIPKIELHMDEGNLASKRVPEKLNFKLEGTRRYPFEEGTPRIRNHHIFGMLNQEFVINMKYEPLKAFDLYGDEMIFKD